MQPIRDYSLLCRCHQICRGVDEFSFCLATTCKPRHSLLLLGQLYPLASFSIDLYLAFEANLITLSFSDVPARASLLGYRFPCGNFRIQSDLILSCWKIPVISLFLAIQLIVWIATFSLR